MKIYEKQPPKWKSIDIKIELNKFIKIYDKRPIRKNKGGMRFSHMFAFYYILKKIKPKLVIESGVFKGQSTWLIRKTLPKTKIISIDIDLSKRQYISRSVKYSNLDFKFHNFSNLPKNTLVFFDDHQNHIDRIIQAKWFGIKHVVFEDNYPVNFGDFYTLKHALFKKGFQHKTSILSLFKTFGIFFKMITKKIFNKDYYFSFESLRWRIRDHLPNKYDFKILKKILILILSFPL